MRFPCANKRVREPLVDVAFEEEAELRGDGVEHRDSSMAMRSVFSGECAFLWSG